MTKDTIETAGTHTSLPWAVQKHFPDYVVPLSDQNLASGGSVDEEDDRKRFAVQIALAMHNDHSGFAHEISKETARANAAFIVKAVNNFDQMLDALKLGYALLEKMDAAPDGLTMTEMRAALKAVQS